MKRALPRSLRWLLSRFLFWCVVFVALIWVTFFGLALARGVPGWDAAERAFRLTMAYLPRLVHGDLGTAYAAAYGQRRTEVLTVLLQVLPRSLALLAAALTLAGGVGVTLGAWAARRRRDGVLFLTVLGLSLPTFFLALVLQVVVIRLTQHVGRPLLPVGGFGWDAHFVLPMLVLAVHPLARVARLTYTRVAEVLDEDYIRTARAKGVGPWLLAWVHVGRVVAPTVLTALVVALRYALSALPVVELYFGWPGLGHTLMRAIARQDDYLSVALALGLGGALLVADLLTALAVRWLDPRQQEPEGAGAYFPWSAATWRERLAAWGQALLAWWPRRQREVLPPLPVQLPPAAEAEQPAAFRAYRRRVVRRALLRNTMLWLGGVLVLGLVALYFFGPSLATHNPYATQGLRMENGQLSSPPYPPSATYWLGTDVLGRDLYSLLVSGARQTLTLVFFAVLVRLALGAFLGMLAGMLAGRWVDRLLTGLTQVLASLPALVVAMLLILGLGVRKGMGVFIVGLSVVGWGEVFQFVRAETVRLLRQPFIEAGVSVGNAESGIVVRYLIPNLLPALLALASLEAAAVLLLIGDLGFVGVFLGGGAFAEVFIGSPPYHYSDVPEWASLLSNVRLYARSYPWTALYPALTFFLAVWAFNLFGEGLRRFLPQVGFTVNRLVNRWTVGAAVALLALGWWVQGHTGPLETYRRYANAFDPQQALTWTRELATQPRGVGTSGEWAVAEKLAQTLESLGLQPAGEQGTYFLTVQRDFFELTEQPWLEVLNASVPLTYREDYAEAFSYLLNAGEGQGWLTVLGMGELTVQNQRFGGLPYAPALADLHLEDQVVLLLHPVAPHLLPYLPRQATLMVADDPDAVRRRYTLSAYTPFGQGEPMAGAPWFVITPQTAERLLAAAGLSYADLREQEAALGPDEVRVWATNLEVRAGLVGEVHRKVEVPHVLAYWPGVDDELDDRLILVLAPYDGLREDVLGVQVPGAVNHASAVGVVLEALRTLKAQGFAPRRTIYVAFYASQGFDYGKTPRVGPDVQQLLFAKPGFGLLKPEVALFVGGVGGGEGRHLVVQGNGSLHLVDLTERLARMAGARPRRDLTPLDISVVFDGKARGGADFPWLGLAWEGSERLLGLPEDAPEALRLDALAASGRTLTLLLAVLGHAPVY